jgi:tRNA dimethylallyltransferase
MPEEGHRLRPPIYLAGPTASGKSAVAMILAERLGGEIISVDSMQVYRGMDIGTAKPSLEDRKRVAHHLLDVIPVDQPFSVRQFLDLARALEKAIEARGKVPIFCGGTGLYFKALVSGIGEAPPSDPALRTHLEQIPLADLLLELEQKDPETFKEIDRKNPRRVIRAVEAIRLSGRPFAEMKSGWGAAQPRGTWIALRRDRAELVRRIDARVDQMFQAGLVEETGRLLKEGLENNPTAMQALGYRQVVEFIKSGGELAETIELVKQKTRQFAKRQMTWFKGQLSFDWLEVQSGENAGQTAARILERSGAVSASG